ncbi:hypothetical protein CDD83_7998 [Cordyceps sp. RAO-2017]|nr:hypothetical protein CDD83_7998 [Cordyceps sp. RAO-2017]
MSASAAPEKAVLIIPGAWHVPEHFNKLTAALESNGIRVICHRLPTSQNAESADTTIRDDVLFIQDVVKQQAALGTHLIVVAHSYGGMVAASLAEFAVAPESSQGGVIAFVFLAAFLPTEDQSIVSVFGSTLPTFLATGPGGMIKCTEPMLCFFDDVNISAEEAQWANSLIVEYIHPSTNLAPVPSDKAAWRVIPSTYVFCEKDVILPPEVQDRMIQTARAQGAVVHVHRLPSCHSPFLSMPEQVTQLILRAGGLSASTSSALPQS